VTSTDLLVLWLARVCRHWFFHNEVIAVLRKVLLGFALSSALLFAGSAFARPPHPGGGGGQSRPGGGGGFRPGGGGGFRPGGGYHRHWGHHYQRNGGYVDGGGYYVNDGGYYYVGTQVAH
jgi:hypothetical protein